MMRSASELLRELNSIDESPGIEAKRGSEAGKSILESIIAFANEPGLGGGYLLLGVRQDAVVGPSRYHAVGIPDPDQLQADIASQCATLLNLPLRPAMRVERVENAIVLVVFVAEAATADKPVYLKATGLPRGAFRRIGSTDQRCTDDDLWALRRIDEPQPGFDARIVDDCRMNELDETAISEYRRLRTVVNPQAEELSYSDEELLEALLAVRRITVDLKPTVAGVLLFGKPLTLRRLFPTAEVSYVRIVGNEWVADPERRFASTLDVRKSALHCFRQIAAAIEDDLPKSFYLPPDSMQSLQEPLVPRKAFREALANAIIHRSYRINQPTLVIRYSNRIEFINAGHSLKPVADLGKAGPAQRNPILASVFRDVEIAEAKGSGIRTIRRVCEEFRCPPPDFISDRQAGTFTTILWLPVIAEHLTEINKPVSDHVPLPVENTQPHTDLVATLPGQLATLLATLSGRVASPVLRDGILQLCTWHHLTGEELATLLKRDRHYLRNKHLIPMVREGLLTLVYPDNPNHPHQAYTAPVGQKIEHG
jgi:ATP-dependent DNA helicase RecG